MRYRVGRTLASLAAVALLGIASAPSFAAPISFVHHSSGAGGASGSLNGVAFNGVSFTITAEGDTAARESFAEGFFIDHISASISIPSVGDFDFITPTRTFVNNTNQIVGFSLAGITGADLFNGPTDAALGTWDMLKSLQGTVTGTGELLQWAGANVQTSGGVLIFNDSDRNAQFRSEVRAVIAVPEPGVLALLGLALAAFGWMRRKAQS